MTVAVVVLAGAAVGLGLTVLLRELLPAHPDLRSALERLDGSPPYVPRENVSRGSGTRVEMTLGAAVGRLAEAAGLPTPRRELDLIGHSPERFWVAKIALAGTGLVFPPLLALAIGLVGLPPPVLMPAAGSIALAAGLFFAPDMDVRRRAADTRREFRRAICSYLDLVALERLADAGAVEALERAATVGEGWVFVRIRDVLTRTQLAGQPPWVGLRALGEQVGVAELDDVADIMSISGEDGAAVYDTLRSRADSLRGAILAASEADANAASEKLIVPVAALGLAFLALLGYPAIARILTG